MIKKPVTDLAQFKEYYRVAEFDIYLDPEEKEWFRAYYVWGSGDEDGY